MKPNRWAALSAMLFAFSVVAGANAAPGPVHPLRGSAPSAHASALPGVPARPGTPQPLAHHPGAGDARLDCGGEPAGYRQPEWERSPRGGRGRGRPDWRPRDGRPDRDGRLARARSSLILKFHWVDWNHDHRLNRREAQLPPGQFRRLDHDRDGYLTFRELTWEPPHPHHHGGPVHYVSR